MRNTVQVSDHVLTLNGLRFHYRDWGDSSAPPLVLLHGGWEAAHTWNPLAAALAHGYRVLMLDQRGHGESAHVDDYAIARMADDLEAFVAALRLDRIALLGYSMGAAVALAFSSRRPERVGRLAFIDNGPDGAERQRARLAAKGRTYAPPPPTDPALTLPEPVLSTLPSAADQWAMVERIACPTLLVHAAQSDNLGAETAERMARVIPHCRLVTIPDSGHAVLRDNPAALITSIWEFFGEIAS